MNTILQDKIFIKKLMEHRNRTTYVRITALTLDSKVKDEIIGRVTEGSVNVDGASAVRRSCNLTLVTDNININSYNWVLNTRFKLEVGIKNNTDLYKEIDIVWFPQGVYIITQFSCSLGTNNYTISLSGQDKMCLMNGEISGQVTAETDFGQFDEIDENGNVITKSLTLKEIILGLVHTYGLEPLENIVIELPDNSGYNLLTYRGQDPLYLLRNPLYNTIVNYTFYGSTLNDDETKSLQTLVNYWVPQGIDTTRSQNKGDIFTLDGQCYYVQKIEYGETAGYEETPLTYAGELKAAVGEAVTNILDKIKNMLGEFEYFYDINGVFRFQKKKTYLKTYMNDNNAIEAFTEGEYSYEFNDLSLFTSFNNNPDIKNLKNDFTVWGEYKTTSGSSLPIHMRLAIDKKPTHYYSPWQKKEYSIVPIDGKEVEVVDWREIIYQMAVDYQVNHTNYNYSELLEATNPDLVKNGRSGYEQYYTDILGFWRYLYEPDRKKRVKKYERVMAKDTSIDKYYYSWKVYDDFKIDDEYYPYTSWYIDKYSNRKNYRISWIDSINLMPSNNAIYYTFNNKEAIAFNYYYGNEPQGSLRRLYKYDQDIGNYSKVLEQKLIEQPYYVYERNEDNDEKNIDSGPVNIVNSNTWGVMDRLENLFLKKPGDNDENSIPLLTKIKPSQMTSGTFSSKCYRSGLYVQENDKSHPTIYEHIFYYIPDNKGNNILFDIPNIDLSENKRQWDALKDAFTKSNKIFFEKNSKILEYNPSSMQAYAVGRYKMTIDEGKKYALYYKNNSNTQLYAQYLMNNGMQVQKEDSLRFYLLDEMWLAYISKNNTINDLIENITIDRNNLYRINPNSIGKDDKFISAFQNEELIDTNIKLYVKDRELSPIELESLEQYEYYKSTKLDGSIDENALEQKRLIEYFTPISDYDLNTGWNKIVQNSPQLLTFWFDFLDPEYYPQLAPYSVQNVGSHPMVKTEKTVTAIYYPETPEIYFNDDNPLQENSKEYFTISSQGQSAHNTIDSWLYNYTYITESVNIDTIPLYNIEANTKIRIDDNEHGINGDYIVDKMTIPLSYNGTMFITATKAPETF